MSQSEARTEGLNQIIIIFCMTLFYNNVLITNDVKRTSIKIN